MFEYIAGKFDKFDDFYFVEITEIQVANYINNLKNNCSQGLDQISTKLIKTHKETIIPILTKLINNVTFSAIFPNELKIAKVIPIYKSKDSTNVANYRPISVLPVLSKNFERNIHDQLFNEMRKHDIFRNNQYAYQPESGTISACISCVSTVQTSLEKKMLMVILFVDFKKAFDSVNHNLLLLKLKKLGLKDASYELIKSYLYKRTQIVKVNKTLSKATEIMCGVPQGSILGPLFFLIFMNDLFDINFAGQLQLYADDVALIYSASTEECLENKMQLDLNHLLTWCTNNEMTVNVEKTNYIIFQRTLNLNLKYNELSITQVYKTKYLGLFLNSYLSWNDHITNVLRKSSPMVGMLWRISRIAPRPILYKIYYAFINSNISYMLPIWGQSPRYQTQKVLGMQKRALRSLNSLKFLDSVKTYFTVQILPIEYYAQYETILLIYKMKNGLIKHNVTLIQNDQVHNYNTRINQNIHIDVIRTNIGKLSINCNGFKLFNQLPLEIKNCHTLSGFKSLLKTYILNKFKENYSYTIN